MIDSQSVASLLAHSDIFANLRPEHLDAIAKVTKLVAYEKNAAIVRQGDTSSELYILANGSVVVVFEDSELGIEQVIMERRAPEFFGEMSLLNESPRTATVRALEETVCAVLTKTSFDSVLDKLPIVGVELARFLSRRLHQQMQQLGFRFLSAEEMVYDQELYRTFSETLLRHHRAIPLKLEGHTLTVAMTRPHDNAAVAALRKEVPGLGIQPVACAVEDYEAFVQRYLPEMRPGAGAATPGGEQPEFTQESGEKISEPLGQLLQQAYHSGRGRILVEMASSGTSLFLAPPYGRLEPLPASLSAEQGTLLAGQLAEFFPAESGTSEVLSRPILVGGKRCEVSVSRLQTLQGPRFSLGLTDSGQAVPTPSMLWPTDLLRTTIEQAVNAGGGAILVVGPSHSGRSTTLYSLLKALGGDASRPNIVTLESEPLLGLEGVAQVRLGSDERGQSTGLDLDRLLKVALSQGPELLMVDEPRAEDLCKILEAAEDGLTVLTTSKGTDPLQTLSQLCSRADSPLVNVENMRLLIGQTLLRRICTGCREEYSPSPAVLSQLELSGLGQRKDRYFKGAGCSQCRGTGTFGRVANFEIVKLNGFLSELLVGRRSTDALRKAASSNGLLFSYKSFAKMLVAQGQILPTEALRLYGGASGF